MDSFEKLKQCKEMLDNGIITPSEFYEMKKKLLNEIDEEKEPKNVDVVKKIQKIIKKKKIDKNAVKKVVKRIIVSLAVLVIGLGIVFVVIKLNRRFKNVKVGDVVTFGTYNGREIEWIVVDTKFNKALLVSKYVLAHQPMILSEYDDGKWRKTYLRKWLNEDFYETAFSSDEQKIILEEKVGIPNYNYTEKARKNAQKNIKLYGPETEDKVFILSVDEAEKYLKGDDYIGISMYTFKKEQYWLRTRESGYDSYRTVDYFDDGKPYTYADNFMTSATGVRPAIWVEK